MPISFSMYKYANPIIGGIGIINSTRLKKRPFFTRGTLGLLVHRDNQLLGLTAMHNLLRQENDSDDLLESHIGFAEDFDLESGDGIVHQPHHSNGKRCGLVPKDKTYYDADNDAGLFIIKDRIKENKQSLNFIEGIVDGYLRKDELSVGDEVFKYGIGTGYISSGAIEKIDEKIVIKAAEGFTKSISKGGDSGSIWIKNDGSDKLKFIGLHIERESDKAIASYAEHIIENLKFTLS